MKRALRILLYAVLALLALLVLVIGGLWIGLNTGAGQALAVRVINGFAGPDVHVTGLGGHFPGDIKLQAVRLADKQGVWLRGQGLELRWHPLQLIHGELHVTSLTAASLSVLREPAASSKKHGKGFGLPGMHIVLDRLEIGTLYLAPPVAGEAVSLHVRAAGALQNKKKGHLTLAAATPDGAAQYHLTGSFNAGGVKLEAHIAEPPDGLIGHYAGPQAAGPLHADISLDGPLNDAALHFALALGAAKVNGAGRLGLAQPRRFADVTFTVPRLAPIGDMANIDIGGSTRLHMQAAKDKNGPATFAIAGEVALTAAPAHVRALLGGKAVLDLHLSLDNGKAALQSLHLEGANLTADAHGALSEKAIDMRTRVKIARLGAFSPDISGTLEETSHITGSAKDFAIQARLTGTAKAKGEARAGPFSVDLDLRHLPHAPAGTLTGGGMLDGAPLRLDAAFKRTGDGGYQLHIAKADWRSASAAADLELAPGAVLPTGTARFMVANLADAAPFSPVRLHGSVRGDFSYDSGKRLTLDLTAKQLVADPALGAMNGSIAVSGKLQTLGVKAQLALAKLQGYPARLSLAGVVNGKTRAARIARLDGAWHGLQARLQAPAGIETKPDFAVQHLRLAVNGAAVAVDGTLWPRLKAAASLHDLNLALADILKPGLGAAGIVNADAALTGTVRAPGGQISLRATGLHLAQGQAAALPPANITGTAKLQGKSADLDMRLHAGPKIALELSGRAPFTTAGAMNLRAQGRLDLTVLNPILAAQGTELHGEVAADVRIAGTAQQPRITGPVRLTGGSVQNIGSGLDLTGIGAHIDASGRALVLRSLTATAGHGTLSAQGRVGLDGDKPVAMTMTADHASPIISDLVTEALSGKVSLTGALDGAMTVAGKIDIDKADINIPHGLPPSVATLPIVAAGTKPPPPAPPPPPVRLDLTITARSHIFIRGDGLFAELAGHIRLGGTLAKPVPQGRFTLVRGNFNLAGKSLQFTSGDIGFSGEGFVPTLNLVATASSAQVSNATLTVSGTAAKPVITLSSSPPLPSDEVLAQLLFGESASDLTPFQAASLAAALAQISGLGGGVFNPLDKLRGALGLDQLSIGGTGSGPPTVQAGRYVAPGVYVGATQSTDGQSSQVNVQINLRKGLKLETSTGVSAGSGETNSVGLTYQFNY